MPRDVAGLARTADGTQPKALLAPYPAEEMTCWPVSPRVGNVKNNHPSLIEPIAGAGWARRIGWPMEAMSWHRWLATLLVMRALAACAKGARPRLHTRHTRWRMCTTGAVTAPGQTEDVWYNYVRGHNPKDYFGIYDVVRFDTFWLDKV
jgi:hypothetical protein